MLQRVSFSDTRMYPATSRGFQAPPKIWFKVSVRFEAFQLSTANLPTYLYLPCPFARGLMTVSRLIYAGKHSFSKLSHRPKDIPVTFTRKLFHHPSSATRSSHFQQSRSYAMVNATTKEADYGNFSLLQSFPVENAPVTLSKWRSQRTGLTVVVGNHESPITNGYFTIASEIFDDTGRPHTLEHLIFLGSKEYPYKGVLDQLANRAGSNGTNAWTANDRTLFC